MDMSSQRRYLELSQAIIKKPSSLELLDFLELLNLFKELIESSTDNLVKVDFTVGSYGDNE